jgi:diacylglycerol kinase family enzyme
VAALGVRGWCRAVPGGARYLAATIPTLASGRSFQVTLCLDDSPPAAFDITTAAAANSQCQGGGIRIAPEADIEDGLADITVVERVSLAEVAANLPILYSGALYSHPKVRHWRARRVRAEAETEVRGTRRRTRRKAAPRNRSAPASPPLHLPAVQEHSF